MEAVEVSSRNSSKVSDIDYFSEEEMVKRSCSSFLWYLPKRLALLLNKAMDEKGHFKKGVLSVLKDYKVDNCHGVKTINCQWNVSAYMNLVPIAGTISYGLLCIFPSPIISLYFDETTGEMISENEANLYRNRNEYAEKYFEKGLKHEKNKNFKLAFADYENAYQECTETYKNRNTFLQKRNEIKNEAHCQTLGEEGDLEATLGNYAQAIEKYQAALGQTLKQSEIFNAKIQSVMNEISANKSKIIGDSFFAKHDYKTALTNYIEARDQSSLQNSTYEKLIQRTEIEIKIMKEFEIGHVMFKQQKYEDAVEYYQRALDMSDNSENTDDIKASLIKSQNEITACKFKATGDQLFNSCQFNRALQEYQSAYDTSNVNYEKLNYQKMIQKTKTEIDAASKIKLGLQLLDSGDLKTGEHEIISAFLTTKVELKKTEYKLILDKIKVAKTATYEKKLGDEAFEAGEYEFAKMRYGSAFLMSTNSTDKALYKSYLDKANNEIDVNTWERFACQAFQECDYEKALKNVEHAVQRSHHQKHQNELEELKKIITNEIEASCLIDDAVLLLLQEKYNEASQTIMQALNKFTLDSNINEYQSLLTAVKLEVKALNEKESGDAAYEKGDYHLAKEKYSVAFLTTKNIIEKEKYRSFLASANVEVKMMEVREKAIKAFHAYNYDQASSLLEFAICNTKHELHKQKIMEQLNCVRIEDTVMKLKLEANQLFKDQNYEKAVEKYQEAKETTRREVLLLQLMQLQQNCETKVKAQKLKQQAEDLFAREEFHQALSKYQEAFDTLSDEREAYAILINKTQIEADSLQQANLGEAALIEGKVNVAKIHYEKALNLTQLENIKTKISGILKSIDAIGSAIAHGKLHTRHEVDGRLSSKLQEQSKLLEEGINLIKEGESKAAEDKIELALNCYEDAGGFLVAGLHDGISTFLKELKRLAVLLKKIQAIDEASHVLNKFCVRLKDYNCQIESIQKMLNENEDVTASGRYEEVEEESDQRTVISLLQGGC